MRLNGVVSGLILSGAALLGTTVVAQSTQSLTLRDAERIAIQNHPKIQAAQDRAAAAGPDGSSDSLRLLPHAQLAAYRAP
jgi:hypothetical protein